MTVKSLLIAGGVLLGTGFVCGLIGSHLKQNEWDRAKAAQTAHELQLIQQADQLEAKLTATTASLDATADALEKAREDALATQPVPAACVDTRTDVDGLRRLIRGGK